MRRILVRAGFNPADNIPAGEIIARNMVRSNLGNMIFTNSIIRSLMTDDDTEIYVDNCRMTYLDAPWINENFESYVIPLADLFRADGNEELTRLARLVKALKIPCVICGVGVRAKTYKRMKEKQPFDAEVYKLMKAVLKKSAIVGVRGELTGEYLTRFGFSEGREFTAVGCPSMYTFGELKPFEKPVINSDSRISVNNSILSSKSTIAFLNNVLDTYENSFFLPQRYEELKAFYLGIDYIHRHEGKDEYPHKMTEGIYAENRAKMFLSPKDWMDFLKTVDLSVGSRLHGNVTAVISGTPSIFIPHGVRMRELVEYHKLPAVPAKKVAKISTLEELVDTADFKSIFEAHHRNFEHYREFLKMNGLKAVFGSDDGVLPYDRRLAEAENRELISVAMLDKRQTIERWEDYVSRLADFEREKAEKNLSVFSPSFQAKIKSPELAGVIVKTLSANPLTRRMLANINCKNNRQSL